MTVKIFKENVLKKLRDRREELRKTADLYHASQQYQMEMDYRAWVSALSEAICVVSCEEV